MTTSQLPKGTITKKVIIDLSRTNQQAVDFAGGIQIIRPDKEALLEMPRGTEREVEILFIPLVNTYRLEEIIKNFGCKLAHPLAVCAVNEQDLDFANQHPNGTQWRDKTGKICNIIFTVSCLNGKRYVTVSRHPYNWIGHWFVACVRESE